MQDIIAALSSKDVSLPAIDAGLARFAQTPGASAVSAEGAHYMEAIASVCSLLSTRLPPALSSDNGGHVAVASTRARAIDVLLRLPVADAVRPALPGVTAALLHAMRADCEENATAAAKALAHIIKQFKHADRNWKAERDAWMHFPELVAAVEAAIVDVGIATADIANEGIEPGALSAVAALAMGRGLVGPMAAVVAASATLPRRPPAARDPQLAAALAPVQTGPGAMLPGRYSARVLFEALTVLFSFFSAEPVRSRCTAGAGEGGGSAAGRKAGPLLLALLSFVQGVTLPDAACLAADIVPSQAQAALNPYISRSGGAGGAPDAGGAVGGASGSGENGAGAIGPPSPTSHPSLSRLRAVFLHDLHVAISRAFYLLTALLKETRLPAVELMPAPAGGPSGLDTHLAHLLRHLACLPSESVQARRDTWFVMRFYSSWDGETRPLLVRELPLILDTRLLLGSAEHTEASQAVRLVAYSVIFDALERTREGMNLDQCARVVRACADILCDPSSPAPLSEKAGRVLHLMAEVIPGAPLVGPAYGPGQVLPPALPAVAHTPPPDRGPVRSLLNLILHTAVAKVEALRTHIPRVLAAERRAIADAEREKGVYLSQLMRVNAAADLVATATKARQSGQVEVPAHTLVAAKTLMDGLGRGSVSPWVADEYAEWSASHAPGRGAGDTPREVRALVHLLASLVRQCVTALVHLVREEAEAESSRSATALDGHGSALPPTPAPPSKGDNVVTVVTVTGGGPNGLGQYSHGSTLGEGELRAIASHLEALLDALDAFTLSPSSTPDEFNYAIGEYAALLDVLAGQDRNHVRDLFATALPTMLERTFRNPALYPVLEVITTRSYQLCKVVVDSLFYLFVRHVHLLNVDDEDDTAAWREYGPCAPAAVAPVPPLPGAWGNTDAEKRLFNMNRLSASNDRKVKQLQRGRFITAGDWVFNEDGEFDAVLDRNAATPDAALAAQQARLPSYILATLPGPGETLRKRVALFASQRASMMLKVFRLCLNAFGEFADAGLRQTEMTDATRAQLQAQTDAVRNEALHLLRPYIGPLVRSLLRNAFAVQNPSSHVFALRQLMRQVTTETQALNQGPHLLTVNSLFAEFASLVPQLADTLTRLHAGAIDTHLRAGIIETAITIPLSMSMQIPHLPRLLRLNILALRWKEDKRGYPSMALKQLEYWCEHIGKAYWEHIFADGQLHYDLMSSLTALLRTPAVPSAAYATSPSLSMEVLKLLPKLGGLSRSHVAPHPRFAHSAYGAAVAGLMARGTWGSGAGLYTPPADFAEHSREEMDAVFEGRAAERLQLAEEPRGEEEEAGMTSIARRAIATLKRRRTGEGVAASSSESGEGGKGAASPSAAFPSFDLPLDRLVHFASRMITRHLSLPRDAAVETPGEDNPLLEARPPASTPAPRTGRVRKRITPSSAPRAGSGAPAGEDFTRPARRRRRADDSGEPQAVMANHSLRPLPVNVSASIAASLAADGPVTVYDEAYASDSDSSGEDECETRSAPLSLTPTQAMLLAKRGPLVSKLAAWEMLSSLLPLLVAEMPFLAAGSPRDAAAHLYRPRLDGPSRAHTVEQGAHASLPAAWTAASAGLAGGAGDSIADTIDAAEKASAMRRVQVDALRALALACTDVALRPLARPVFVAFLRAFVLRAVSVTPPTTTERLPAMLREGGADMGDSGSTSMPFLGVSQCLEPSAYGSAFKAGEATHAHPVGADDPLLLNILLASIACDEPPSASLCPSPGQQGSATTNPSGHPLRALLLECLDEAVGTLAIAAWRGEAEAAPAPDVAMGGVSVAGGTPALPPSADHAVQAAVRACLQSPVRQLHAVAVTGSLLLPDLIARLAEAARSPSSRAKQGACHTLVALLARTGPALAQAYAPELLAIAVLVLSSYEPDQAAITVVAAFNVVNDVIAGVLEAVADAGGACEEMRPLPSLSLTAQEETRLAQLARLGAEWMCATSAAVREVGAAVMGGIARHFLTPEAGANPVIVARGVLTILAPYAEALAAQIIHRKMRQLAHPDVVGSLFALSAILTLCKTAGADASVAPVAGEPAWKLAAHALLFAPPTSLRQLGQVIRDTCRLNQLYDVNAVFVNPAYASAAATFATLRGRQGEVSEGAREGKAAAPVTVMGVVTALGSTTETFLGLNISSASNPPFEVPRSATALHALLSAAQPFPYPLSAPGGPPAWLGPPGQAAAGTKTPVSAAWLDPWSSLADPFTAEQLHDGAQFVSHLTGLPRTIGGVYAQTLASVSRAISLAGVTPSAVGLGGRLPPVAGDLRAVRVGMDGFGVANNPANSGLAASPALHVELEPRPYSGRLSEQGPPEFRPPNFALLLRIATLRAMEAVALSMPAVLVAGLPAEPAAGEGGAEMLPIPDSEKNSASTIMRQQCTSLLFDSVPQERATGSNLPEFNHTPLVDSRHVKHKETQLTGHCKSLLAALSGAFAAFAPLLRHWTMRQSLQQGLRPMVALVMKGGAPGSSPFAYSEGAGTQHLDTLAVVVSRLQPYFAHTVADTLLSQLEKHWLHVNSIREMLLNSGRETDIAGAISNLFALLPLEPVSFLPRLVRVFALLDAKMHIFRNKGPLTSTVRRPFARFLSAYPSTSCDWFFEPRRLLNPAWANLLVGSATMIPDAGAFLGHVMSPAGCAAFVAACFPDVPAFLRMALGLPAAEGVPRYGSSEELAQLHAVGLWLLRVAAGRAPAWLPSSPALVGLLLHVWHAPTTQSALAGNGVAVPEEGRSPFGGRAEVPWRSPLLLWSNHWEHVVALRDMLLGLVQQVARRTRRLAEVRAEVLLATGGDVAAASAPALSLLPLASAPALPTTALTPVLCALLSSMSSSSSLVSHGPVRAVLEEELATAPDADLTRKLLQEFLGKAALPTGPPKGLLTGPPAPSNEAPVVPAGPVGLLTPAAAALAQRIRALALRHIVSPLVRHSVASEEGLARLWPETTALESARAYVLAGGRPASIAASQHSSTPAQEGAGGPLPLIVPGTSSAPGSGASGAAAWASSRLLRTPSSSTSAAYHGARTPSTAVTRSGGFTRPLALPANLSTPQSFTPFTTATPRLAGVSWSEATYAPRGRGLGEGAAAPSPVDYRAVFAASYPFPRLLDRGWAATVAALVLDSEEEELREARELEAGLLYAGPGRGAEEEGAPPPPATTTAMPPHPVAAACRPAVTELRLEQLRLLDTALVAAADDMHAHRKLIVRVAWRHIKRGEPPLRAQGMLVMARYTQIYQLAFKTCMQVLGHLLGWMKPSTSQPNLHMEFRDVHRRALNILLPSMHMRASSDAEWVDAVRMLNRVLLEETTTLPAMTALLPVILDHTRLLYAHRARFTASFTSMTHKIADPASLGALLPLSHKALITDTLTVIATWQAQARLEHLLGGLQHIPLPRPPTEDDRAGSVSKNNSRSSRRPRDRASPYGQYPFPDSGLGLYDVTGAPIANGAGGGEGSGGSPEELQAFTVGYAAKAALLAADTPDSRGALVTRSMALFATMLRLWPDAQLQPAHVARGPAAARRLGEMKAAVAQAVASQADKQAKANEAAAVPGAPAGPVPRVPLQWNAPSSMGAGSEEVSAYACTLLELLLSVSGSCGRAVDFLAEHPGFMVEAAFSPAFLSADRRTNALMRRLVRRLLVLYPHNSPPLLYELSRLYHWLLVVASFRIVLYNALSIRQSRPGVEMRDERVAYRTQQYTSILNSFKQLDQPNDQRMVFKETLEGLGRVAARDVYSPALLKAGVDASGRPLKKQDDRAQRATEVVKYYLGEDYTAERAAAFLESYEADKKLATAAWEAAESEFLHVDLLCRPGTPGYVPQAGAPGEPPRGFMPQGPNSLHVHVLGIVRLFRDMLKYAPPWIPWTSQFLTSPSEQVGVAPSLLVRLSRFHLEAEEYSDRVGAEWARVEPPAHYPELASPEVRSLRATALTALLPLLCLRDNFTRPLRDDIVTWAAHLMSASSDAGVLRTTYRMLSTLIAVGPTARDPVLVYGGLSERRQRELMSAVFAFLTIPEVGPSGLSRAVSDRIRKVAPEVYADLSGQYYGLMLELALGSRTATASIPDVIAAIRGGGQGATAAGRGRASLYWLSFLEKQFIAGTIAGGKSIRDECTAMAVGYARWRREKELGDEVTRIGAARGARRDAWKARVSKRRADGSVMVGPLTHGLAFPLSDPYASGRAAVTPLESQAAAFNSRYAKFEDARYQFFTPGEADGDGSGRDAQGGTVSREVLQQGVDPNQAAALEAALMAATGGGGADRRSRMLAFAGVEAQPSPVKASSPLAARSRPAPRVSPVAEQLDDGMHGISLPAATLDAAPQMSASALTALQDVLSLDWDGARAYVWLQSAVRIMMGGLATLEAPTPAPAPALAPSFGGDAAVEALLVAQDSALKRLGGAQGPDATRRLVSALSAASTYSVDLAAHLWTVLFPAAWAALTPTQRERMAPFLQGLLTKESGNLFSKDLLLEVTRKTGASLAQTSQVLGVQLGERERDGGCGPAAGYAEGSWGGAGASASVSSAVVGSAELAVGLLEEPSGTGSGLTFAPPPSTDLSLTSALHLIAAPMLPLVPFPPEMLLFLGRNVGLYEPAARALEGRLTTAVASARDVEEQLRALQKEAAASAAQLAASLEGTGPSDLSFEDRCLLDTNGVYAAAIARPGLGFGQDGAASGTGAAGAAESSITALTALRSSLITARMEVQELADALMTLYSSAGMEDAARGLRRLFATTLATARGADNESVGLWAEAGDAYGQFLAGADEVATAAPKEENRSLKEAAQKAAAAVAETAAAASAAATAAAAAVAAAAAGPQTPALPDDAMGGAGDVKAELAGAGAASKSTLVVAAKLAGRNRRTSDAEEWASGPPTANAAVAHANALSAVESRSRVLALTATADAPAVQAPPVTATAPVPASSLVRNRAALLRMLSSMQCATPESLLIRDVDVALLYSEAAPAPAPTVSVPSPPPASVTNFPAGVPVAGAAVASAAGAAAAAAVPTLTAPAPLPLAPFASTHKDVPSSWEASMWEARWVESQRAVGEWRGLQAYAGRTGDSVLYAEACAAMGAWDELFAVVQTDAAIAQDVQRSHASRLLVAQLTVAKVAASTTGTLDEAASTWLTQWQALPPALGAGTVMTPAHEALLFSSQRILEVREGLAALLAVREGGEAARTGVVPEVRALQELWRERMPNAWDSYSAWDSVLSWRANLLHLLHTPHLRDGKPPPTDAVALKEATMIAGRSSAWSMLQSARAARKLGLRRTALALLARVPDGRVLETSDAALRAEEELASLRVEPVEAAHASFMLRSKLLAAETTLASGAEDPGVHLIRSYSDGLQVQPSSSAPQMSRRGLELAVSMSLENLSTVERAERWRQQGLFAESYGGSGWSLAYMHYSAAAGACPGHNKTWLSWAQYLDRLAARLRVESRNPKIVEPEPEEGGAEAPAPAPEAPAPGSMPARSNATMRAQNPLFIAADLVVAASADLRPGAAATGPKPLSQLPVLVACQAISAYLEAIAGSCSMAVLQLARPLFLLFSGATPVGPPPYMQGRRGVNAPSDAAVAAGNAALQAAFGAAAGNLPVWLWLPWLPQLFAGLTRPGDEALCRLILRAVVFAYPQAVHGSLRLQVREAHDAWSAAGRPAPVPSAPDARTALQSLAHDQRVFHPVITEMDAFLSELGARVERVPVEEELQHAVHANMLRMEALASSVDAYRLTGLAGNASAASKADLETRAAAHAAAKITETCTRLAHAAGTKLVHVHDAHYRPETARHNRVVSIVRAAFLRDFAPTLPAGPSGPDGQQPTPEPNPDAATSVDMLLPRLRVWRARLLAMSALRTMHASPFDSSAVAPTLRADGVQTGYTFMPGVLSEVEVPCQYGAGPATAEPLPSRHVRIAGVRSGLGPRLTGAGIARRLVVLGDDGRRYGFGVATVSSAYNAQDGRLSQLHAFVSALLARAPVTRSRHLSTPPTLFTPVSSKVRLVAEVPSTLLLSDVMDRHLRVHGPATGAYGSVRGVDDLHVAHRGAMKRAAEALARKGAAVPSLPGSPSIIDVINTEAMREMCAILPETALSSWAASAMASPEAFLGFRLRFGRSLTTTSLMAVLLSLSDRSAVKLAVSLSTGAVVSTDTRPSYFPGPQPPIGSIVGLADNPRDTSAPFRMTRNIVALATPQAVLGVVGGGLTASTRVLQLNTDWLAAYLAVMFRDEVIAVVAQAKTSLPSDSEAPALLRRAQNNTTRVLDRVHNMASTAYGPDSPLIQKTPVSPVPGQELLSTPVHNLLLNAMAVKHLIKMPPAWAPWM